MPHPGVVAGVVVGAVGLLLLVVLVPLSLQRLSFDEVGITYDKVSRSLGTEILREGLHDVGPSGTLIVFKTTQRTAHANSLDALTSDGILLTLDVSVSYTININDVPSIVDEFGDQDAQDDYLNELVESVVRDVAVRFSARSFYLQREDFQTAVQTEVTTAFSANSAHATVSIVQVINVNLPSDVQTALQSTTTAQQDIQNALTERAQDVQAAEIQLNLTSQQATLLLLDAQKQVNQINQNTQQAVLTQQNRILQRTYAFSNISTGLGLGGNFFVNSYLKALVVQSNPGKTIIAV